MRQITIGFMIMVLSGTAYGSSPQTIPQSKLAIAEKNSGAKNAPTPETKNPQSAITLGAITTDVEGDLTIVTARLNRSPEWANLELEEHGTFLQIKLPNTQIPNSGEFSDGNGPFLRKLASFQVGSEDGALRLFVNQDAAKAKLATTAELLGDRIVITIDHKKLEQLITPTKPADATASISQPSNPAPSSNAATTIANDKQPEATSAAEKPVENNLHSQLTKGAAICALLFLTLIGFQFTKSRRSRGRTGGKNADYIEPATMRVLSTVSVGPKQKLTLVQVGHQQLLLGVTSDAINLLTNVESRSPMSQFSRALENANPTAEIKLKNPAEIAAPRSRRPLASATLQGRTTTNNKGSSINVAVGEDGPVDMKAPNKSEEDITKILRDRLRNLPPG